MTTPEPVSPAPDTEALREGRLWSVLDWSLWGNGLGDVLRSAMADVMVAALTPEQREQAEACIKSWHERRSPSMAVGVGTQLQRERDEARAEVDRLKSYLLGRRNNLAQILGQPASEEDTGWYGLCAQVQEREAGLRADLDHARRERDRFADLHRGEARTHDETIASLNAVRAERDTLSRMLRGMARRLGWMRSDCGDNLDAALGYKRERDEARAELERSVARTIPDDAAERVAEALREVRLNLGPNTLEAIYGGANHLVLSGAERHAIALTAIEALGLSTPTTDPAPAAADGEVRVEKLRRQIREYREELAAALGDRSQKDRNMFPLIRDVEALRQERDALRARLADAATTEEER